MDSYGVRHLGHCTLAGRSEGLQVVGTGARVFVSHLFSGGFSEVDISDPRAPRTLSFTRAPARSWSLHLQVQDHLLLVANGPDMWAYPEGFDPGRDRLNTGTDSAAGVRLFDVGTWGEPREIGFAELGGAGVHRVWFDGGPLAFVSATPAGFGEAILVVLDVSVPSRPVEVDRWWIPGMAPGEEAMRTWPPQHHVSLHHATVADGFAFGAWRDGGVTVQTVSAAGRLGPAVRTVWPGPDGQGSAVHSAVKLPGTDLVAVVEEGVESQGEAQRRIVAILDVSDSSAPRRVGWLRPPQIRPQPGARFGPHNLHEYRPGAWMDGRVVFSAHQGAGLRVYRLATAGESQEIAHFRPDAPVRLIDPRPGRIAVAQTNDVFVTATGLMAVIDANSGLDLVELAVT